MLIVKNSGFDLGIGIPTMGMPSMGMPGHIPGGDMMKSMKI